MQSIRARAVDSGPNHFRWPIISSSFLVLPFMVLEFVNRRTFLEFPQSFPIPLFATMWLLAFAFVYILTRVMRGEAAQANLVPALAVRLLGIAVLGVIAYAWVGLVLDQMPCFLGVPNCD